MSNPAQGLCLWAYSDPGRLALAAAFGKTLPRLDDGKEGLLCVSVCVDTFVPLFMAGVHFAFTWFPAYFIAGVSFLRGKPY